MCTSDRGIEKPEVLLAREFKNELGVQIDPDKLFSFVRDRWSRVSVLAHSIHDAAPSREEKLKTAAKNIAALSPDGLLNVLKGNCHSTLRDDVLLLADEIRGK